MMRQRIFIILLLLSGNVLYGQTSVKKPKHFILQGQLKNYPANEFHLIFTNKKGEVNETIPVDNNGKFYYESPDSNVYEPLPAVLWQRGVLNVNLFIAPGYNLVINADCKNGVQAVAKNKQIEGYGATANRYLFKRDSIVAESNDKRSWYELNAKDLVIYENKNKHVRDSIIQLVFNKRKTPDEYCNYFKEYIELDNKFARIDHITWHTVADSTLKTYQQSIDFVAKNIDTAVLSKLYDEKYLESANYREFMVHGYYQYLYSIREKKFPSLIIDRNKYRLIDLEIIDSAYKGKIKCLTLFDQMHEGVEYCRSWDELKMYQKAFPAYIAELTSEHQKDQLKKMFLTKESELVSTQIGKPAPEFTAQDSLGKVYDLANYKGKVVLLDLWASWCGPCRYQTPYLGKIIEKYKADNRIAFISVDILDGADKWKQAMAQDKPTWLQLHDNNNVIPDAYVAHSIPKFIVINKLGNIVSFDAPMPSDEQQLEKILDAELSK